MIGDSPFDLTPVLAPFGWAAAAFVIAGLATLLCAAMRERRAGLRPVGAVTRPDPRLAA